MLCHAFDACANTDVNLTSRDLISNLGDGGQAGAALAVDGIDGDRVGKASGQNGH
jgi:hypothetical protein